MDVKPIRLDSWPLGINNIAKPSALPTGAVRDLVNLDPSADGVLGLRAGYSKALECSDGRAAFRTRDTIIVVDGQDLVAYHPASGERRVLGQVAQAPIAGVEHNGELYLSTPLDSVRTDGATLKPWAIPAPGFTVEVVAGGTLGGRYRVALVAVGADGEESGADSILVDVPPGSTLQVRSPDPRMLRLYASVAEGATLFYQGLVFGGGTALTSTRDDTEYLTTDGLVPMPYCEELVSHHGVIVGRRDNVVFFSAPLHPHLMDPVRGFFQFGSRVRLLASTDGGVYIVADKTYFVSELESKTPRQRTALDIDAVEGTAVTLPDDKVAWFTRYGQVVGSSAGEVRFLNRDTFAPDVANVGAAGVVGFNGNELVVTTMRGAAGQNNLSTGDYAELET